MWPIEVKTTKDIGKGIFCKEIIKKGTILFVDEAISVNRRNPFVDNETKMLV